LRNASVGGLGYWNSHRPRIPDGVRLRGDPRRDIQRTRQPVFGLYERYLELNGSLNKSQYDAVMNCSPICSDRELARDILLMQLKVSGISITQTDIELAAKFISALGLSAVKALRKMGRPDGNWLLAEVRAMQGIQSSIIYYNRNTSAEDEI